MFSTSHFLYSIFFSILIAAVEEVIRYHQIDLAPLVVAEAVAEVTVEVAATGEEILVNSSYSTPCMKENDGCSFKICLMHSF